MATLIYWTKWSKGHLKLRTLWTCTLASKLKDGAIVANCNRVTSKANPGKMPQFRKTLRLICPRHKL